ncbi:MAG: 30S ribosomal protein S2, partial [Verrucomicrobiota bacterium]
MSNELLTELVEAGVHFGHQSKKWNPKMRPYILGEKHNVHLINLNKTVEQIDSADNSITLDSLAAAIAIDDQPSATQQL